MRLLFRYAGGLACLVTALALVGCGGGPGAQPEPNQIENQAFRQGEQIRTIPLSDKFSGSDLTYSATTSNARVATVAVDNDKDTLTLTAVGPGTATITVTAENNRGEAKQTFTVTVPQPPPPTPTPDPDPVEIPNIPALARDTARTIPLGDKFSGENLTYTASSSNERVAIVSVNQAILTVRAVGPGTATITVTATAQGSADQTQTFTVTVPQPVEPPTVIQDAESTVTVAQGATSTITLSTVFTGTGLSFTASSSATAVATVSESGGTLTITGVSIGPATITIVARNTAGSSLPHAIAVTVTAPVTPTPTPTPTTPTSTKCPPSAGTHLEIVRDDHAECTLQAGQRLISEDPSSVSVKEPSKGGKKDVWIVTAKKKGLHRVFIFKGSDKVGEILVKVPNSPPTWTGDPSTNPTLTATTDDTTTHTTSDLSLTDFFNDVDEADRHADLLTNPEVFNYAVSYAPEGVLIDTRNEFVNVAGVALPDTTAGTFKVVILKRPEVDPFTIELLAHDGEDFSDNPVTLTFAAVSPRALTYSGITQSASDGSLEIPEGAGDKGKLRVSNRIGVGHEITITGTGYIFATLWDAELVENRRIATGTSSAGTATVCTSGELDGWKETAPDLGDACYSITSNTRDVKIGNAGGSTPTTIMFELPSTQRSVSETGDATITITYNVWALPSAKTGTDTVDNTADKGNGRTDSTKKVTLALDLDRCVKATDCP